MANPSSRVENPQVGLGAKAPVLMRSVGLLVGLSLLLSPTGARAEPACAGTTECHEAAAGETPRGIALGTGNRASANSTSALLYNTAGLTSARLYHIEGDVDYQPTNDVVVLGASVVDSITTQLAAGLAFRGSLANSSEGFSGIDVLLGLGFPFGDQVSVGVSGRYVNLWQENAFDGSDDRLVKGLTLDTALRIQPAEMLHVAFLAYNVIDRESEYVPVTVGGSTSLVLGNVINLGADVLVDLSTFDSAQYLVGGGLEYLSGQVLPLRIGYSFDAGREIHAVSGGVGYVSQKFSADLSLKQQVAGGDATRLMAGVRFHVY